MARLFASLNEDTWRYFVYKAEQLIGGRLMALLLHNEYRVPQFKEHAGWVNLLLLLRLAHPDKLSPRLDNNWWVGLWL